MGGVRRKLTYVGDCIILKSIAITIMALLIMVIDNSSAAGLILGRIRSTTGLMDAVINIFIYAGTNKTYANVSAKCSVQTTRIDVSGVQCGGLENG